MKPQDLVGQQVLSVRMGSARTARKVTLVASRTDDGGSGPTYVDVHDLFDLPLRTPVAVTFAGVHARAAFPATEWPSVVVEFLEPAYVLQIRGPPETFSLPLGAPRAAIVVGRRRDEGAA